MIVTLLIMFLPPGEGVQQHRPEEERSGGHAGQVAENKRIVVYYLMWSN